MCVVCVFLFARIRGEIFSAAVSKARRMENFGVFRRRHDDGAWRDAGDRLVRASKFDDQIYVVLLRCFYTPLAKLC